jgi:hypothetical protein
MSYNSLLPEVWAMGLTSNNTERSLHPHNESAPKEEKKENMRQANTPPALNRNLQIFFSLVD